MSKEEELKALLREAFVLLASGFRPYSDESDKEFAKTLSRIRQAAYAVEKKCFCGKPAHPQGYGMCWDCYGKLECCT